MRRRRRNRAAELTPLIDVLFILLFASLIQARSAVDRDTRPAVPTPLADAGVDAGMDAGMDAAVADAGMDAAVADTGVDATGKDSGADANRDAGPSPHLARAREIATVMAGSVENRDVFVVEVTHDGLMSTVSRWSRGQNVQRAWLRERLLRPPLPGEAISESVYRGATDPTMRLCSLVQERFAGTTDEFAHSVILVVLDVPVDELPLALYLGLQKDFKDCFRDGTAVGILLNPGEHSNGIR